MLFFYTSLWIACNLSDSPKATEPFEELPINSPQQIEEILTQGENPPPEPPPQDPAPDMTENTKALLKAPKIQVSGTIEYAGSITGTRNIEALQNPKGSDHPILLVQQALSNTTFKIEIPENTEAITLMAYIDINLDGITDDDPRGYYKITTTQENIDNIHIEILDLQDLEKIKD